MRHALCTLPLLAVLAPAAASAQTVPASAEPTPIVVTAQPYAPVPQVFDPELAPVAYEPTPAPRRRYRGSTRHGVSRPLLFVGGAGVVAGWLASIGGYVASITCESYGGVGDRFRVECNSVDAGIMIPVVGPWLGLGDAYTRSRFETFLIVDGVVQAAGMAAMILSLTAFRHGHGDPGVPAASGRWMVTPMASADTAGAAVWVQY